MIARNMRIGRLIFAFSVLFLVLSGGFTAAQSETKRMLVLYSMDRMHPAHEMTDQGIRSVLMPHQTFGIELFSEYLDLSRFEGPGYEEALVRFLGDKYAAMEPDLLITVYPSALKFILNHRDRIFPGISIVACTIFESTAKDLEQANVRSRITGVIFKGDIGDIVPMARTLKPGMRQIALVGGSSEVDKFTLTMIRNALK